MASTQVHVILLMVCNFTVATYFRVGIHMCSGLGSLEIFLNCPEEWGLQHLCFGSVSILQCPSMVDLRLTWITAPRRCSVPGCKLTNPQVVSDFNHSAVEVLGSVPQIDKSQSSFGDKS